MIVVDTSGVLSWIDGSQNHHRAVAEAMKGTPPPYVLSPLVLAELDYLIRARVGATAARAFAAEVARGTFELASWTVRDVQLASDVCERYGDLDVGLTDASLVVLAERYRTHDILTLDERHFRVMTGHRQRPFRLLPMDWDPSRSLRSTE